MVSYLPFCHFSSSLKSMSVTCTFALHVPVTKSSPIIKQVNKIVMLNNNKVPGKKVPRLQIRSCSKNKVFEDQSEGVICYRDENGEIVCEGYDEGPRFPQKVTGTLFHLRDAEILDLLQDRWLQIVTGGRINNACEGVFTLQDDLKVE